MNDVDAIVIAEAPTARVPVTGSLAGLWRALWDLGQKPPLMARYVLVSGAIGVPGAIVQLWAMRWIYTWAFGGVNTIELNALWILNFEIGLVRNFLMHCFYTWGLPPTRERVRHAHVAAIGAIIIDLIAFNAVVQFTGMIPLAQVIGAGTGFVFNYGYNKLKTFALANRITVEGVTP